MKGIYIVARETFVLLRRDKIFLPMIVVGLCLVLFASMAQESSLDELEKVLFDMGTTGFFFTGIIVCLLWGIKSVCESRRDGSIELQLVAPISRGQWLLGKYLGLCISLLLVGIILIIAFQVMLYLDFREFMSWKQLAIFAYLFLGWLVFAAICILFATFCNTPTATFSSFCVWIIGMISGILVETMPRGSTAFMKGLVKSIATFWDFQRFNLTAYASTNDFPPTANLLWFALYGFATIALLLAISTVVFSKRDLV